MSEKADNGKNKGQKKQSVTNLSMALRKNLLRRKKLHK